MTFSHYDFEYIDIHTHFFPPEIFEAIWNYFENLSHKLFKDWSIKYKFPADDLVKILKQNNVKAFTTFNYAHKSDVAHFINEWTKKFTDKYKNAIPFGCVWPEDKDRVDYVRKIIDDYGFYGIKIQPLVQNFYPNDDRMDEVYELILDRGKWICFHAGTAPYRNQYVGYKNFIKFVNKYPDMNLIIAHMGAYEYLKFLKLLDSHENFYLDTAMIFIPDNVFPERKAIQPKPEDLISYQDRILFGSDFPNIPYEYTRTTKGLFELDLDRSFYKDIFFNNAKRLFNISFI